MSYIISTGFTTGDVQGDPGRMAATLDQLVGMGCTGAEISMESMQVIENGVLQVNKVNPFRQVAQLRPLIYSLQAPSEINLMNADRASEDFDLMRGILAFAADIGAGVVSMPAGRCRIADWGWNRDALLAYEADSLLALAEDAADLGVQIALGRGSGQASGHGAEFTYAIDPLLLARQLGRLCHGALTACLDISRDTGIAADFAELAPWIGHVMVSNPNADWVSQAIGFRQIGFGQVNSYRTFASQGAPAFLSQLSDVNVQRGTRLVIESGTPRTGVAGPMMLEQARVFTSAVNGNMI